MESENEMIVDPEVINETVAEEAAENTEQTAEQSDKIYSEEEFNTRLDEILGKKIARREAKIRKEYERKYGNLEEVLRAGTGKESVEEIASSFRDFYAQKGIEIPEKSVYSNRDMEVLAKAEAEEIIGGGDEEVNEEINRLAEIGAGNMTPREKAVFRELASYQQNAKKKEELEKVGASKDIYDSADFREFSEKFNSKTPISEIYDLYMKTKPKKEIKTMGSVKNSTSEEGSIKDFYTREEALKFTKKDLDKNPELYRAIEKSMLRW